MEKQEDMEKLKEMEKHKGNGEAKRKWRSKK
jgi:hypothetical protein